MAAIPTLETVPELRHEAMTGEELAQQVADLMGMPVEEVKENGVQSSLVALHLAGRVPEDREDLIRLATGESIVRPTAFTRVTPDPTAGGVLIAEVPMEDLTGPQQIDSAMGIRPGSNGPNVATASAAASAANVGRPNDPPIETTHLMCEKVQPHRLSRNGAVNNEVSHALDLMDCGTEVKNIWRRLDGYVTVDSQDELDKIENVATMMANRMKDAATVSNNVNECMMETGWWAMTKAERMFLTKGKWEIKWRLDQNDKENLVHDLVHVYDWILLPASIGESYYETGEIDLSRFPCHQLNGSFCALTAMRKTVQWYSQGVFDENAPYERLVFIVRRRSTVEATREWTGVTTGAKKMKLNNYFNRQFTDHISTQNGFLVENELKTVPSRWVWSVPTEASRLSMGIIRMSFNDAMSYTKTGPQLLCLSEMEEWSRNATIPRSGLIEWRLMGHTMVPTAQAYGSGLEHDCSTWDEMYADDDGEDQNAWNAPTSSTAASKTNAGMTSQGSAPATVLSQVANALNPGAEVVLRMNGNAKNPVLNVKSVKK
ncbi:unnamed protein product [Symbiodinium sp. CCMP2456]|nr:unnamed protein product [Symbiodinium sp. CCMP2456]